MNSWTMLFIFGSSLWVYFDAKSLGVKKGQVKGLANIGPLGWLFSCWFLWILAFPLYLSKRSTFKQIQQLQLRQQFQQTQQTQQPIQQAQNTQQNLHQAQQLQQPQKSGWIGKTVLALIVFFLAYSFMGGDFTPWSSNPKSSLIHEATAFFNKTTASGAMPITVSALKKFSATMEINMTNYDQNTPWSKEILVKETVEEVGYNYDKTFIAFMNSKSQLGSPGLNAMRQLVISPSKDPQGAMKAGIITEATFRAIEL